MKKQFLSSGIAIATVLCGVSFAAAQSTMSNAKMGSSMSGMRISHTFKIAAQNGSGENGNAKLTQSGDSLR